MVLFAAVALLAQLPSIPAASPSTTPEPQDLLGRTSPRGTVIGFLQAAHNGDLGTADQYLQMSDRERHHDGPEIAHKLQVLMDRSFTGHTSAITDRPEGKLVFDSTSGQEKIGTFQVEDNSADVVLVRVPGPGGQIWLFSSQTVADVSDLFDQLPMNSIEQHIWPVLVSKQFLGAPIWIWLGMILLVPAALAAAWVLVLAAMLPRKIWEYRHRGQALPSKWWEVPTPAWFLVAVVIHRIAASNLGLPFLYRFYYSRFVLILLQIGLAWAIWQVIAWAGKRAQRRAIMRGEAVTTSFLLLGQRVAKALVIAVCALAILSTIGVNTSAAVAGLGIGGIAIAFASQKTLENLFGGALVLSDQTIRVGDVVNLGNLQGTVVQGTVEDVNLRATRLRTTARTEISVPNGALATMNVENLTARDKILLQSTIGLRRDTTPDQLRFILAEFRRMLYSHPRVEASTARVRFITLAENSLDLEFFCYIQTREFTEFLAVREDILLRILDIVDSAGSSLAMPSQTLYLARDSAADSGKADKKAAAHAQVAKWREDNKMPFPDFPPDAISGMRNSIDYPKSNSAIQKK
ncbi:MAG TPA: mechanosensitive ion channel family protein [Terriglobales bacterium]